MTMVSTTNNFCCTSLGDINTGYKEQRALINRTSRTTLFYPSVKRNHSFVTLACMAPSALRNNRGLRNISKTTSF